MFTFKNLIYVLGWGGGSPTKSLKTGQMKKTQIFKYRFKIWSGQKKIIFYFFDSFKSRPLEPLVYHCCTTKMRQCRKIITKTLFLSMSSTHKWNKQVYAREKKNTIFLQFSKTWENKNFFNHVQDIIVRQL